MSKNSNPDWIDKHSVNCYFCNELVDERDCCPADLYNDDDGGEICLKCIMEKENDIRKYNLER